MNDIAAMSDPELREAIAVEILGWKVCKGAVPPDCEGANAGDVLTPDGNPIEGWAYPPKGLISLVYHVPMYTSDWGLVMQLARKVGMNTIPGVDTPIEMCRQCLAHWREHNSSRIAVPSPDPQAQVIKQLLDDGGYFKYPYKEDWKAWCSDVTLGEFDGKYKITGDVTYQSFDNFQEAWDHFQQEYMSEKNLAWLIIQAKKEFGLDRDRLEGPKYLREVQGKVQRIRNRLKKEKVCPNCMGAGVIDSGGQNPNGTWIDIPCPECSD